MVARMVDFSFSQAHTGGSEICNPSYVVLALIIWFIRQMSLACKDIWLEVAEVYHWLVGPDVDMPQHWSLLTVYA